MTGLLQALLGCEWGHTIHTEDDPEPCGERAVVIVVLHEGKQELGLKLCPHHRDRVLAETTPHAEGPDPGEACV